MRRLLVLLALASVVPPGVAAADVREGRTLDPRDGRLHEHVDGSSYRDTDIELVAVRYDTAGAISIHVRLFEPFADRNDLPRFQVCSAEAPRERDPDEDPSCPYPGERGDLTFSGAYSASSPRLFELSGYEGTIPATISFSDDGRSLFVDGRHPALADRGYNVADSVVYDGDVANGFLLYGPGAFTACSDGLDNDADETIDREDYGCDAREDVDERLDRTPSMSRTDALGYLKRALTEEFGSAFRHRAGWRRACARTARTRFRCRVAWAIGDTGYRGVARFWHDRNGERVTWSYAWRIVRTDEYCKYVLKRKRCTKVHVA